MKKIYLRPTIIEARLEHTQPVLVGASQMDVEVDLGTEVGDDDETFVKRGHAGSVWDDDWSQ